MTPEATAKILVALEIEHRPERAYDEADCSHVVLPSGSLVASFDRAFLGAAGREALASYDDAAPLIDPDDDRDDDA